MNTVAITQLLSQAIPGDKANPPAKDRKKLSEEPYLFWSSNGTNWAVFLPLGGILSAKAEDSIRKSRGAGFEPVVIACDDSAMAAAAKLFLRLRPYVVCEVSRQGILIPPPEKDSFPKRKSHTYRTRIQISLLRKTLQNELPIKLRNAMTALLDAYKPLSHRKRDNDVKEHNLLITFANRMLLKMGFFSTKADATKMLRSLEVGGWGGRREHFFHSFQNYFLGLAALSQLKGLFDAAKIASRLGWNVDPFAVWLLIALYHDVGYGMQNVDTILQETFGTDDPEVMAEATRTCYLQEDGTRLAIKQIASLLSRLLRSDQATSTWSPPTTTTRWSTKEKATKNAILDNFSKGHGASSAIRLYRDLVPKIEKMHDPDKRNVLRQTVLLACCSIPLHDAHFRQVLAVFYNEQLRIPTDVMPYAATLAFIDSIQDDRRDLQNLCRDTVRFLKELQITLPSRISAKLDKAGLSESDVLWKIVEGRDVMAHLLERDPGLTFRYPAWIVD